MRISDWGSDVCSSDLGFGFQSHVSFLPGSEFLWEKSDKDRREVQWVRVCLQDCRSKEDVDGPHKADHDVASFLWFHPGLVPGSSNGKLGASGPWTPAQGRGDRIEKCVGEITSRSSRVRGGRGRGWRRGA